MRWRALIGCGAIMAKIGLHDVAQLAAPYRIGITGALGCVLLLSAWGYARCGSRTRKASREAPSAEHARPGSQRRERCGSWSSEAPPARAIARTAGSAQPVRRSEAAPCRRP